MLERLFTSKTRVKILTLFMINPDKEMFVRQITRATDENINSVRRELSNLEEIGLLMSKKKGNLKYYNIKKDFPIYKELKNMILKTEGVAKVINDNLNQTGDIKTAFIYGSSASGEANLMSDIDIFLVGDPDEDQLLKEILKLEKTSSRKINYVLFNENEFEHRIQEEDHFVLNVLQKPKIMIIGDLNAKKTLIRKHK